MIMFDLCVGWPCENIRFLMDLALKSGLVYGTQFARMNHRILQHKVSYIMYLYPGVNFLFMCIHCMMTFNFTKAQSLKFRLMYHCGSQLATVWPVVQPGHYLWIDFTAIVLAATNNVLTGEWNGSPTSPYPQTGVRFVMGDRPSFPLLTVYVADSAFSFSVGSNYFHG